MTTSQLCRWLAYLLWTGAVVGGLLTLFIAIGVASEPGEVGEGVGWTVWGTFVALSALCVGLLILAGRTTLAHARMADEWLSRESLADVFGGPSEAAPEPSAGASHLWHVAAFLLVFLAVGCILFTATMLLGASLEAADDVPDPVSGSDLAWLAFVPLILAALAWWGRRVALRRAAGIAMPSVDESPARAFEG